MALDSKRLTLAIGLKLVFQTLRPMVMVSIKIDISQPSHVAIQLIK